MATTNDQEHTLIMDADALLLELLECGTAEELRQQWLALSEAERAPLRTDQLLAAHARRLLDTDDADQ